jgi:alanine dehydrogenase
LRRGINIHAGNVSCEAVAKAQDLQYQPVPEVLAA